MKKTFSGFYSINESTLREVWLDKSTLFIFDTNCLLNLYRCEDQTRVDILNVMRAISDRIWIPFQVGFEYQRNRRKVIEESIKSLDNIKKELEKIHNQNILSSSGIKLHLYNSLSTEISELQKKIKSPIEDYIEKNLMPRIKSKEKISEHDSIRDQIDEIIKDRVGSLPTQDQISTINSEGITRYANKQPPGFMDEKKVEVSFYSNIELQDKYGDLYLWKQILEKAKEGDVKNVVFVCDDGKKDWWFSYSGKTHGVLESLKTEICRESEIENFKAINQLTFLHEAKAHLQDITIQASSLKEIEELSHISQIDDEPQTEYSSDNKFYSLYKKNSNLMRKALGINHEEYQLDISNRHLLTDLRVKISKLELLIKRAGELFADFSIKKDELMKILPLPVYEGTYTELIDFVIDNEKFCGELNNFLEDESRGMRQKIFMLRRENIELDKRIDTMESSIRFAEGLLNLQVDE